jgi:hypothetical protein
VSVVIFVGPTLYRRDPRSLLDAEYRPPAAQGDVLRAALAPGTRIIGIVDGYFECIPAVWHKEILWAMAHGIHVFGSASMGALRAAELRGFGMEGVGRVYQAIVDGELEDDDEVAVVHAPSEFGYRPASEAMVNVRATLSAAEAAEIVSSQTAAIVIEGAKSLFYPERHYPRILEAALTAGAAASEIDALGRFLPSGRVDQKRMDALEMLETIRSRLAEGMSPKRVVYTLEHTAHFSRALEAVAGKPR